MKYLTDGADGTRLARQECSGVMADHFAKSALLPQMITVVEATK